jgi:propanediol utilization protein
MNSEMSRTDAAILAIEAPFRRLGWYLRTSGIVGRAIAGILGAAVLLGAVASILWLATSFGVAL